MPDDTQPAQPIQPTVAATKVSWKDRFIAGIFSETNEKPSFTRVSIYTVLVFSLFWVTVILFHNLRVSPNAQVSFPEITGLIEFVGALTTILYGSNKFSGALKNGKDQN